MGLSMSVWEASLEDKALISTTFVHHKCGTHCVVVGMMGCRTKRGASVQGSEKPGGHCYARDPRVICSGLPFNVLH